MEIMQETHYILPAGKHHETGASTSQPPDDPSLPAFIDDIIFSPLPAGDGVYLDEGALREGRDLDGRAGRKATLKE